jgi:hypothetical protein
MPHDKKRNPPAKNDSRVLALRSKSANDRAAAKESIGSRKKAKARPSNRIGEHAGQADNPRAVSGHNKPPARSYANRLNGIEKAINTYNELRNDMLRQGVAEATEIALEIHRGGPASWAAFIDEPRWKEEDKPPRSGAHTKVLYHVFRWIFGMAPPAASNASFYSRAVRTLLDEGVEVGDLEEQLKTRTLKRLAADRAASNRARKAVAGKPSSAPAKRRSNTIASPPKPLIEDLGQPLVMAKACPQPARKSHYDGSIEVVLTGNTQPFLGLEAKRQFVLRGRILALGKVYKIAVDDAFLDPQDGE